MGILFSQTKNTKEELNKSEEQNFNVNICEGNIDKKMVLQNIVEETVLKKDIDNVFEEIISLNNNVLEEVKKEDVNVIIVEEQVSKVIQEKVKKVEVIIEEEVKQDDNNKTVVEEVSDKVVEENIKKYEDKVVEENVIVSNKIDDKNSKNITKDNKKSKNSKKKV
jgi:hypothetical protein